MGLDLFAESVAIYKIKLWHLFRPDWPRTKGQGTLCAPTGNAHLLYSRSAACAQDGAGRGRGRRQRLVRGPALSPGGFVDTD